MQINRKVKMEKATLFLLIIATAFGCGIKRITYYDQIPAHDSITISSKFINEDRLINIWTPPSYNGSTDSFPVLYMPDGGIKEDFPHIANTLAKLIEENKIPPLYFGGYRKHGKKERFIWANRS